jgi:hypothetical protein
LYVDEYCPVVETHVVVLFKEIQMKRNLRMFELVENHPPHWPPFVPPTKPEVQTTGAGMSYVTRPTHNITPITNSGCK